MKEAAKDEEDQAIRAILEPIFADFRADIRKARREGREEGIAMEHENGY
jgi:flagellar biosynthesis/type III secretory pathway protein FliH